MIEVRRPDTVVVDKVKKDTMTLYVAIPGDARVCDKEREKIRKYSLLKDEIMANEKGRCDSHCTWSIRNYNNSI